MTYLLAIIAIAGWYRAAHWKHQCRWRDEMERLEGLRFNHVHWGGRQ